MAMMTPEMAANYIASQQKRLKDAQASKNNDLATRLINDISRVQGKYPTLKKTNNSINNVPFINYDSIYTNNNAKTPMQMVTNQGLAELKQKQEAYKQENQLKTDAPVTNSTPSTMNINTPSNTFNYNPMNDERFKAYFQPVQAFTYDPKSDPLYQTALQNALAQARANAKVASQNALESLNERGILNSSIASNQLAQIEQNALTGAQSQLESNLIPQLVNQAYQRYQDNINNQRYQADLARGLTNDNYQRFMDSITNNRADQQLALQRGELLGNVDGVETLAAKNANRNFGLQKGELLGTIDGKPTFNAVESNRNYELALQDNEQQAKQLAQQMQLNWAELEETKKQNLREQANRNAILNEQIRSNKADEASRATNAQANLTRAETAKQKATNTIKTSKTDQKRMTANQQQTFVKNSIDPLLVNELGKDSFEFDYKTGRNVIKQGYSNQFVDVMKGIRDSGLVDDNIIRLAFLQYGVPIPNGFVETQNGVSERDIMSFPNSSKSNAFGINPEYLK